MIIPCVFHHCTIRQRLVVINTVTVILLIGLISIYTYQLIALEQKMVDMREVDDLMNSILDVRRYEKNIMLGLGDSTAKLAQDALDRVELHLTRLGREDLAPRQDELLSQLRATLKRYQEVFTRWCATGPCSGPGMASSSEAPSTPPTRPAVSGPGH